MRLAKWAFVLFLVICMWSGALIADNKKSIVGKWEATKTDSGALPAGSIVEFMPDGRMKITVKADRIVTAEGTYSVEGDSCTFRLNGTDDSKRIRITKLDERELDSRDKDNKPVTLKRIN